MQPQEQLCDSKKVLHETDIDVQKSMPRKRKQVKNACVNCQKACKKCDDGRPCQRCIKLGITATCTNSSRKERRKGVKRGPYKKRRHTLSDGQTMYTVPIDWNITSQAMSPSLGRDPAIAMQSPHTSSPSSSPSTLSSPLSITFPQQQQQQQQHQQQFPVQQPCNLTQMLDLGWWDSDNGQTLGLDQRLKPTTPYEAVMPYSAVPISAYWSLPQCPPHGAPIQEDACFEQHMPPPVNPFHPSVPLQNFMSN